MRMVSKLSFHSWSLSLNNIEKAEKVFEDFINMYKCLKRDDGQKIICSQRRTGPLGFIECIVILRELVALMKCGEFKMDYLRCHKLQQDHLEQFLQLSAKGTAGHTTQHHISSGLASDNFCVMQAKP